MREARPSKGPGTQTQKFPLGVALIHAPYARGPKGGPFCHLGHLSLPGPTQEELWPKNPPSLPVHAILSPLA